MVKTDDGKVIASLTEVKNKTGDIFAVVDQFGEISISSYNKIKYIIKKVDIDDLIDFKDESDLASRPLKENHAEIVKKDKKIDVSKFSSVKKEVKIEKSKPENEVIEEDEWNWDSEEVVEEEKSNSLIDKTIDLEVWDRNNAHEKNFIDKAIKPLIN